MGDKNAVRDRTLVLRVMAPALQKSLRDKMNAVESEVAKQAAEAAEKSKRAAAAGGFEGLAAHQASQAAAAAAASSSSSAGGSSSSTSRDGQLFDLEGVSCSPVSDGDTLWNFKCDGRTYPARLMNLPCPVEIHKTYDHAVYYKSADIAQVLLVYENMKHLEEIEGTSNFKIEGFPSYYHSGVSPPMKRVVGRRFAAREHKSVAPPREEVLEVEKELCKLIETISKDSKGKSKAPSLSSVGAGHGSNKVIEEIEEEVVDYEPWMDDHGRQPNGVEFDEKDVLCTKHPEVWWTAKDEKEWIKERQEAAKKEEEERQKKKKDSEATTNTTTTTTMSSKKEDKKHSSIKESSNSSSKRGDSTKKESKKKNKKKEKADESMSGTDQQQQQSSSTSHKKGIPAKKSREAAAAAAPVDDVTQAATQIARMENDDKEQQELLDDLNDFFGFGEGDELNDMDEFADLGLS